MPERNPNGCPAEAFSPKSGSGGVYSIINRDNLKIYIGSALNFGHRWRRHRHDFRFGKNSPHIQRAFSKNPEAFEFSVLEECSRENVLEREQFWINFYRSFDPNFGYNISPTAGSCAGIKQRPEVVAARAVRMRGIKHTEQQNREKSLRQTGKKRGPAPAHVVAILRAARIGRPISEASEKKRLQTRKEKRIGWVAVERYSLSGELLEVHPSVVDACKKTGAVDSNIALVCDGKRKSCAGFVWRRAA